MNKTQIRLQLEKEGIKATSNRIGEVGANLGFGDSLMSKNYSEVEAKQILDFFRQQSAQLPNLNRPHPPGDRHTQANNTAQQSTVQDKAVLANRTREQLGTINRSLQKIETDRNNAVEQVSDTLAYLYSPQTFQADVMRRTSEKLGLGQSNEPEPLTLDSLADCFANFANTVEYPAIAPSTVAGALPL